MTSALFALSLAAVAAAPDAAPKAVVHDPVAEQIGRELRCPVCQGMPIGESPSEMAQAMMQRVREMHTEGKSKDEITDYFVQRYGEWVLLEPKHSGFSLLVWVLPPVALLAGLGIVIAYVRHSRTRRDEPTAPVAAATDDPYLQRVRKSLEEDV